MASLSAGSGRWRSSTRPGSAPGHGGQDADHDDIAADLGAAVVGPVERLAQVCLQPQGGVAAQLAGRDVELDVVAGQLGLELGSAMFLSTSALSMNGR
jgi:hypothetical protein